MPSLIRLSKEKGDELHNNIIKSKSKPTLHGTDTSYVGAAFDKVTGDVDVILPRKSAPDTIGRSINIAQQLQSKQNLILRLKKKLAMRQKN